MTVVNGSAAYQAAFRALVENRRTHVSGSVWEHVKTGRSYRIVAHALAEATLTPVVVYTPADENAWQVVWTRPAAEFLDGRFIRRL